MSKSNWQLGIEVIGIVSIVGSLTLVTVELKQNQDIQIAQAHTTRADRTIELNRYRTELELFEIEAKYNNGLELSASETNSFRSWITAMLWHFEDLYFQRLQGLINDDTWEAKLHGLRGFVNQPLFELIYPELVSQGFLLNFEKGFIELAGSLQE